MATLLKIKFQLLLGVMLISILPIQAEITEAALKDIRIFINFESGSGYENNTTAQDEFTRGARMAMSMWESILPTMHVTYVPNQSNANLIFNVGNYAGNTTYCSPLIGGGAPGGTWDGCSKAYNSNGNMSGGNIYFNTHGYIRYFYDRFTNLSRQTLYSSYEPATYPTFGYGNSSLANGQGYINGRFKAEVGGSDICHLVFHEFGHSVGINHITDDALKFYGIPYPASGTKPTTPNIIYPNTSTYPLLPGSYYGGGTPSAPWKSDIRPLGMNLGHMCVLFDNNGNSTSPAGVPGPGTELFNFHVVPTDDFNQLSTILPPWRINYPQSKGLIRLATASGTIALTPSWKQAINLAQLDRTGAQSNPYLVKDVYNGGQTQKVAAGASHTLAIRDDGTLWAWGSNADGQLGNGTLTNSAKPISIGSSLLSSGMTWVSVAAGENFSLALRSDYALFAWGNRQYGQVGDGVFSSSPQTTPKQVSGAWAAIKAGPLHALALKTNGTLWGWGYNADGELGNNGNTNQSTPVQEYYHLTDWIAFSAGANHSMGLRVDGTLWTWGRNDFGALGDGSTISSTKPVAVLYGWQFWKLPDAGHEHTIALSNTGELWTWGRNQLGQLGNFGYDRGSADPDPCCGNMGFVTVAAGSWHNVGIKQDGSLWSWGYNYWGQLGANIPAGGSSSTIVREATNSTDWTDVFPGKGQTFAMKSDGTLWAWGNNDLGQLGTGTTSSTAVISPVKSLFGDKLQLTNFYCSFPANFTGYFSGTTWDITATSTAKPTANLSVTARGNIAKVEFFNGTTRIGSAITAPPWAITFPNMGRGQYQLTAKVTDNLGGTVTSSVIVVRVHQIDFAGLTTTPSSVNLTTEAGTSGDWLHWGLQSTSSNLYSQKQLTTSLLDPNLPGSWLMQGPLSTTAFSWTDGKSPNLKATNTKTFAPDGYGGEFGIPSVTSSHVVKVYIKIKGPSIGNQIEFRFDGHPIASKDIPNSGSTSIYRIVTITYALANSNLKSTIRLGADWFDPPDISGIQAAVYK